VAHPLVVAALPQAPVVPRAAEERRQLGELRLAAAVLDVLVRDAQPLHELDEVEGLGAQDLDVFDGLEGRVDGVDEGAVDGVFEQADERHGHLVEDHHHDVAHGALLQLVGQVVDPRGAQQHEHLRDCRRRWVGPRAGVRLPVGRARGAPGTRTPPG
jgi:hypothetical protein